MIGFARRAGKTVIGTEQICREMPKGKIRLAVISATASEPTKKKLTVKGEFYGIPTVVADLTTEALASLIGKTGAVAAVGITDERFAEEIIKASATE